MSYRRLRRRDGGRSPTFVTTPTADRGINEKDLKQFLDLRFATEIENYLPLASGRMVKRKGLERLFQEEADGAITMLEKYTDDIYFFAYGNDLKAYTKSTDTVTIIKSNFTTTDPFTGVRYGDYFFICNGGDKIGRVSRTINYDAQTTNFTVGNVLTGGISGATAIILEDDDSGATGTLTLGSINGTFQDNEALSDEGSGDGTADGTVSFTYTEISDAPKAKVIKQIGTRLFAGNLSDDPTAVQYSEVDDGTNPPFSNWTAGTDATDPGQVRFGRGGAVQSIVSIGANDSDKDIIHVVFGEDGKFAFTINSVDVGGTLTQDVRIEQFKEDFGGSRAAINTNQGIFYINEGGLWRMIAIGGDNEMPVSEPLLGEDYFEDVDLSQVDMIYDDDRDLLLITLAKDSSANNRVLVYDIQRDAFSNITGWKINRWMKDGEKIYGGSSTTYESTAKARVWEVFKGFDDDGEDIWTKYVQEINFGALYTRKSTSKQYYQGKLSPSTEITVKYNIYDREGRFVPSKKIATWTVTGDQGGATGFGDSAYSSPYGGDVETSDLIESFSGSSAVIKNFQRLQLEITENSKVPHEINWISIGIDKERPIRRRNITITN